MKLYIIRHGQDYDNAGGVLNGRRNTSLTNLGRLQAKQVAQELKYKKIDVIYSSPLRRALETAQIVAKKLGVKQVKINNNLIERDFGILTGKLRQDISKYVTKIVSVDKVNYFLNTDGAEKFPALYERANKVLKEVMQQQIQNTLLVTHGDIGKMIRAAYYKWGWEKGLKTPYFDNVAIIELK